jgi:hypothetical protein
MQRLKLRWRRLDEATRRSPSGYLIRYSEVLSTGSRTNRPLEAELHVLANATGDMSYSRLISSDTGICLVHDIASGCDSQWIVRLRTSAMHRLVRKLRQAKIKYGRATPGRPGWLYPVVTASDQWETTRYLYSHLACLMSRPWTSTTKRRSKS